MVLKFAGALAVVLFATGGFAYAQISQPSQVFEHLQAHSLLREPSTPPFHLRADFQANGKVEFTGTGTYEEWWQSNSEWRKEVTLGQYHLVLTCDQGRISRSSTEDYVPMRVYELLYAILPSLPKTYNGTDDKPWTSEETTLAGLKMQRLARSGDTPRNGKRVVPENAYYVVPDRNLIVMRAIGYELYMYDKPAMLGDRSVMLDGKLKRNDSSALEFHITSLKANEAMDASLFTAAAGAKPGFAFGIAPADQWPEKLVRVSGSIDWQRLRTRGHGGMVLAHLQIDPNGIPREIDLISESDSILADMVLYDVHHFKFEPMIVDGIPQTISYHYETHERERRPGWNYK